MRSAAVGALCLLLAGVATGGSPADFAGKWHSSFGLLEVSQDGSKVSGTWGAGAENRLEGRVEGRKLDFTYRESSATGKGTFTLGGDGHSFTGTFRVDGGRSGEWSGWRQNPEAGKGDAADLGGLWRSTWGTMDLAVEGDAASGPYGSQGWSFIEGTVTGRRFAFRFRVRSSAGEGWVEVSPDGKSFAGCGRNDGPPGWFGLRGQRLEGFERGVAPKAGKLVPGIARNLMTYHLRAPKRWRTGKQVDAIVILHGSNMSAKAYAATIAGKWKALADRYMIIGIDGESWVDASAADDPRHNYTYVNFMGRSTLGGYPGTDRESPALVKEVVTELKESLGLGRIYVGGHSQGGFLTYVMHMHYPELFAGAFPMSCALLIQCAPDVFDDDELERAQRETPLAMIHGRNDPVVDFGGTDWAHRAFLDAGFPYLRLLAPDRGGHMFALLPVDEAVAWLDALSSDDAGVLVEFAEKAAKEKRWRDVAAAVRRWKSIEIRGRLAKALARASAKLDAAAKPDAERFAERIEANEDGTWIDEFLAFRGEFEFAEAAAPAMESFRRLREEHEGPAKELYDAARRDFRSGNRAGGYAKYERIATECYASSFYWRARDSLRERK